MTVPDVLNPIIVAENPQSLGYRLVNAAGTNFNRMFNFLKIETGKLFAMPQRRFIIFVFSSSKGGGFSLGASGCQQLRP